jgi:hypothetical protein
VVHPEQVAAYLAYLTKATEDFGLSSRVRSAIRARAAGASPHAVPFTKSWAYSVTFGQIRRTWLAFRPQP